MSTFKTIIIGDETAIGLDKAMRTFPGTLPLWVISFPGAEISTSFAEKALGDVKKIEDEYSSRGGEKKPTLIVVSLARSEILTEPDNLTGEDLSDLATDAREFVAKLNEAGSKIVWVLPPAITGERKARATISKALEDAKVRVFHTEKNVADTKASRAKPFFADIPEDVYTEWAKGIIAWVPIGPRATVIVPRHPTTPPVTKAIESVKTALSSLSRNEKIAAGAATAVVVVGGVVAIQKLSKRKT